MPGDNQKLTDESEPSCAEQLLIPVDLSSDNDDIDDDYYSTAKHVRTSLARRLDE